MKRTIISSLWRRSRTTRVDMEILTFSDSWLLLFLFWVDSLRICSWMLEEISRYLTLVLVPYPNNFGYHLSLSLESDEAHLCNVQSCDTTLLSFVWSFVDFNVAFFTWISSFSSKVPARILLMQNYWRSVEVLGHDHSWSTFAGRWSTPYNMWNSKLCCTRGQYQWPYLVTMFFLLWLVSYWHFANSFFLICSLGQE